MTPPCDRGTLTAVTSFDIPGGDREPRDGGLETGARPLARREALELLAGLVAMFAVIFLLALTMGVGPIGQG